MNRKNNPLVSLAALVLLAVILVLACTGCGAETEAAGTDPAAAFSDYRFSIDYEPGGLRYVDGFYVITDNQTGVQYLYVQHGYSGGLTVLQPGEE